MSRWILTLSLCVVVAGCQQSQNASMTEQESANGSEMTTTQDEVFVTETQEVAYVEGDTATLEVPKMMCPFACYPNVKETLESLEGIEVVELVPQKEKGLIDDRRVTVTFAGQVSSNDATSALAKAGFPGATFE